MAKNESNATTFYANVFKAWPKAVGAKPTAETLATVHKLGARPGKQALALALMLQNGVSGAGIVMACGAPQLNKMRDLCTKGYAKRVAAPATAEGHTVYRLELTKKGEAKVAKAETEAAEKPAKVKAKGTKRKSRRATAAEQAAVETVLHAGDNAQAAEAPQGDQPQA